MMSYITDIPHTLATLAKLSKCQLSYSPKYMGLVISHGGMSEVLLCKSVAQLEKQIKSFISRVNK